MIAIPTTSVFAVWRTSGKNHEGAAVLYEKYSRFSVQRSAVSPLHPLRFFLYIQTHPFFPLPQTDASKMASLFSVLLLSLAITVSCQENKPSGPTQPNTASNCNKWYTVSLETPAPQSRPLSRSLMRISSNGIQPFRKTASPTSGSKIRTA